MMKCDAFSFHGLAASRPLQLATQFFFFFNDTATTEIYTLSLHDALPIAIAIAAVGTAVIMMVVNATLGAKAGVKEQLTGLDLSEHGEEAYFGEQGAIPTPGLALGEGVIVSSVPAEPARAVVVG